MRLLLDTTLCIDLMRGKIRGAFEKLRSMPPHDAGISTVTLAELLYGAAKSNRRGYHEQLIASFCAPLAVAPFDSRAAECYGDLRASLERAGTPIGPLDTLIAAHALALGTTLVTANVREFRRVTGLNVENWRSL